VYAVSIRNGRRQSTYVRNIVIVGKFKSYYGAWGIGRCGKDDLELTVVLLTEVEMLDSSGTWLGFSVCPVHRPEIRVEAAPV
jgi:hypothetical protein